MRLNQTFSIFFLFNLVMWLIWEIPVGKFAVRGYRDLAALLVRAGFASKDNKVGNVVYLTRRLGCITHSTIQASLLCFLLLWLKGYLVNIEIIGLAHIETKVASNRSLKEAPESYQIEISMNRCSPSVRAGAGVCIFILSSCLVSWYGNHFQNAGSLHLWALHEPDRIGNLFEFCILSLIYVEANHSPLAKKSVH